MFLLSLIKALQVLLLAENNVYHGTCTTCLIEFKYFLVYLHINCLCSVLQHLTFPTVLLYKFFVKTHELISTLPPILSSPI